MPTPFFGNSLVVPSVQTPLYQSFFPECRSLVQDYAYCSLGLGLESACVEASPLRFFEQISVSLHPRHRIFLVTAWGYLISGPFSEMAQSLASREVTFQ